MYKFLADLCIPQRRVRVGRRQIQKSETNLVIIFWHTVQFEKTYKLRNDLKTKTLRKCRRRRGWRALNSRPCGSCRGRGTPLYLDTTSSAENAVSKTRCWQCFVCTKCDVCHGFQLIISVSENLPFAHSPRLARPRSSSGPWYSSRPWPWDLGRGLMPKTKTEVRAHDLGQTTTSQSGFWELNYLIRQEKS